ncbi:hypothetical protein TUBRATIS_24290 [Tubulinosema ratisbonensis]|uniref:Uncharacterized protein n=1 Tax=Tubulinosema ratisbonensis TaxID=291195 RepID=A0A437AIZ0_9MICR|nr:hypothetical protein TUBRATIS_24290 [Tubulinosema ratisbonensis]
MIIFFMLITTFSKSFKRSKTRKYLEQLSNGLETTNIDKIRSIKRKVKEIIKSIELLDKINMRNDFKFYKNCFSKIDKYEPQEVHILYVNFKDILYRRFFGHTKHNEFIKLLEDSLAPWKLCTGQLRVKDVFLGMFDELVFDDEYIIY